jgi:hypothetical protein
MSLLPQDITFVFSGGSTNSNPNHSLGGHRSNQVIIGTNLFGDLDGNQTIGGITDYRCVYINNLSEEYGFTNTDVYFSYIVSSDVVVKVGFDIIDEVQSIVVIDGIAITEGGFTLTYTDQKNIQYPLSISGTNEGLWYIRAAENMQSALQTIPYLEDVVVNVEMPQNDIIFTINFQNASGGRHHKPLQVSNLNLGTESPSNVISFVVETIIAGGPINSIADTIDVATTRPANIVFGTSFFIGDLRPMDFLPIWIQRIAPSNSNAVKNDGFTLRIKGDVF